MKYLLSYSVIMVTLEGHVLLSKYSHSGNAVVNLFQLRKYEWVTQV